MDRYSLLANQASESKETIPRNENDNDDSEHDEYENRLGFKSQRCSSLRYLWTKHSLMIVLAASVVANLLFGVLSFILLHKVRGQTVVQASPPDASLYSQ